VTPPGEETASYAIAVARGCRGKYPASRPTETAATLKLVLHVDGGARGNPGPAALGVVLTRPDGELVEEIAEPIGVATNNVAEYQALLRGLERARALGATELEIVGDSELVARQLTGAYKVRHPALKPLHQEASSALRAFERWRIRTVPRAENARADELVNAALDAA
jgi:ribonuclease HI